jgi:GNAT superfamily N-acetyltransferase
VIDIVPFRPEWAPHFTELNRAWIERLFVLEEADWKVLRDPQAAVIDKGGHILYAVDGAVPVGTVAVVRASEAIYELAKMAVAPSHQRHGLGERLGRAAIDWARAAGASLMFLETNSGLTNAIRLYERLGFRHAAQPHPSPYARSDVYMELPLRRGRDTADG